ncbi:MAG: hypothetical protein ACK42C_07350, partial [Aquificaceae bacterium]
MKDLIKDLLSMEESLWERRMKVLYQYQRVKEMREKIAELEKIFEEELGVDFETAMEFVEKYEKNSEEVSSLRNTLGDEVFYALHMLADRVKQIREMKKEVDDVEREVFEIDGEIDEAFKMLQEY